MSESINPSLQGAERWSSEMQQARHPGIAKSQVEFRSPTQNPPFRINNGNIYEIYLIIALEYPVVFHLYFPNL